MCTNNNVLLENLICKINKNSIFLKAESSIHRVLLYRIFPCIEIDSSQYVRSMYKEYFGEELPESSDTIFNAVIPLKEFSKYRLINLSKHNKDLLPFNKNNQLRKDLDQLIFFEFRFDF